jgi:hypothetical protein
MERTLLDVLTDACLAQDMGWLLDEAAGVTPASTVEPARRAPDVAVPIVLGRVAILDGAAGANSPTLWTA